MLRFLRHKYQLDKRESNLMVLPAGSTRLLTYSILKKTIDLLFILLYIISQKQRYSQNNQPSLNTVNHVSEQTVNLLGLYKGAGCPP